MLSLHDRSIGGHILMEVGDGVALGLEIIAGEAGPAGSHGIDPRGVIDKIVGEALGLDLLHGEVAGELIDHGRDHLKMRQLLGSDVGQNPRDAPIGHGRPLGEVAEGGAQLPVGSTEGQHGTHGAKTGRYTRRILGSGRRESSHRSRIAAAVRALAAVSSAGSRNRTLGRSGGGNPALVSGKRGRDAARSASARSSVRRAARYSAGESSSARKRLISRSRFR